MYFQTDSTTAENADLKKIIDELATPSTDYPDSDPNLGQVYSDIVINLEKIFGLSVDDYYYYDVSFFSF